jgi:O-antigen/teichoic acid export membrane protein
VFLVTARFVSKESFGIMAISLFAVELFRQIFIESVGTTFYAKKSPSADDYNAGFFIILLGGALSAAVIFLFARPIAAIFGHSEMTKSLRWISALLLTTGLSKMHEIWLTKHLKFRSLAMRSVSSICVGGAVGICMAVKGYGIDSLIAQQIVTGLVSLVFLWTASDWRPGFSVRWTGRFVSLNSLASMLSNQGDVLLSSYFLGPAATGVYNAAKRLLTAATLIISSGLNSVALPALAAFADNRDAYRRSYLSCVGLTAMFTAPLFAGLAVLSPDVIHVLMGNKWADAAPVLAILAVTGFNRSVAQYSSNILLIEGKVYWLTLIGFCKAGVNIAILFIFARYGLIYLAAAFAAKNLLLSPVTTHIALQLLNIRSSAYLRKMAPPALLSLVMAAFIALLRNALQLNAVSNIALFVPVGAAVYFLLFYLCDRKTLWESIGFLQKVARKSVIAQAAGNMR